jgi:hypothetical protein
VQEERKRLAIAAKPKATSRILAAAHVTARDLHRLGAIDKLK